MLIKSAELKNKINEHLRVLPTGVPTEWADKEIYLRSSMFFSTDDR
jgi:hypothetical protein